MYCQNCGQVNTQTSNFCRFCGTKITPAQSAAQNNFYSPEPNSAQETYENSPPRPYSWKTDEFQIQHEKKTKTINRVEPLGNFQPPVNAGMQTYQQPQMSAAPNFHCPRCASNLFPRITRQISTAGWIVFAALLITFFPLFWIGLLIKEDVRVCPVCNYKYL